MDKFSFRPNSPGMRIIWFLQFKPEEGKSKQVDLYIPTPFNNEWHNASGLNKTLENLNIVQKVCHEIKEETTATQKETTFITYIKKLKDLLKNLTNEPPTDKKDDETE